MSSEFTVITQYIFYHFSVIPWECHTPVYKQHCLKAQKTKNYILPTISSKFTGISSFQILMVSCKRQQDSCSHSASTISRHTTPFETRMKTTWTGLVACSYILKCIITPLSNGLPIQWKLVSPLTYRTKLMSVVVIGNHWLWPNFLKKSIH